MKRIREWMSDSRYWAHTDKQGIKKEETLAEHSRLCLAYYHAYCRKKGMDHIVKRIIRRCGCDEREAEVVYALFVDAIYQHDIGKINPAYQRKVLGNKAFPISHDSSNHAMLSAYIYLCEHLKEISKADRKKFSCFLFSFSYSIARHHGYLKDAADYRDELPHCIEKKGCYEENLDLDKPWFFTPSAGHDNLKKVIGDETAFYILNKLLFSMITACDYCATAEYQSGRPVEIRTVNNLAELRSKYHSSEIYASIARFRDNPESFAGSINEQRCRMFLETERNLRDNHQSSLYYLEAPTGSGKTNMSVNLFLTMLEEQPELNNVFYIFPFNTLVEQTAGTLEQYFEYGRELAVVNSITPIHVEKKHNSSGADEEEDPDYEKAALNKLFVNYPLVITSHVHFFNALFGTSREQCFALGKLCNSVVIIDEIQSYRNAIWQPVILFLLQYANLLNMKIIIMSATLPKLHVLLNRHDYQLDECIKDLIKDPQIYYQNPLFKNRVELDFSMLDGKKTNLNVLLDNVLRYKDKKVLVEFISKTTAREFYNLLRQAEAVYCVEITGDDNVRNRKKIIADIQSCSRIIVVATQVIEAGVDIDMDVGFKDVSLPDAEEQFLGRINRSCRKNDCKAYFFDYDDARKIYRDDQRVDYPVTLPYIAALLKNKDFAGIYEGILRDIKTQGTARTREHIQYLHQACLEQNYRMIEEKMRLISPTYSIFLTHELKTEEGVISGREVWQKYKALSVDKHLGYGEKQVKLSELAEAMSYFTYTVYSSNEQRLLCDEEFGGYYYIENGDIFIEDGKFNRKAFSNHSKGLFL